MPALRRAGIWAELPIERNKACGQNASFRGAHPAKLPLSGEAHSMDKINRLLEHSARYFGLDGAPPECWDDRTSRPEGKVKRTRTRRSATAANTLQERDKSCTTLHRAFIGRR
jgi:hypothetical protein